MPRLGLGIGLSFSNSLLGGVQSSPFISTWRTTTPNETVTLPYSVSGAYAGSIDWGDGTITSNTFGDRVHTYEVAGDYVITISGFMRGWAFNNTGDRLKIRSIQQWGCFNHGDLIGAFWGCNNLTLTTVTDVCNVSSNTTLHSFFRECTAIITINNLNDWNVSNITSLQRTFSNCTNFNQDLNNWDVSKVTSLNNTFNSCILFNGNVDTWDVSNVIALTSTFFNCASFNRDITDWQLNSCTGLVSTFQACSNFNQPIGIWNVDNVTSFAGTFNSASAFNQPLNNWNTSKATVMNNMFANAVSFDQPLNNWDVSKVTLFNSMFSGATIFNQDISMWDVSSATNTSAMFNATSSFNQNLSNWNVSNVTNMSQMFRFSIFNQNIGSWNVSKVTDFSLFMNEKTPATFSTVNLDAIYNGWTDNILQATRTITFGTAKRTAASTEARALLTRTNRTVAITNAVDNGSGFIRITAVNHGLTSGNKVFISGVLGATEANGAWTAIVVDADTIDLNGSAFTNTYISGGTLRTGYGWVCVDGGI